MSNSSSQTLYKHAHQFCSRNKKLIAKSKICGCFHCRTIFQSEEIVDWAEEDDENNSALCPYCGIDSVLPSAAPKVTIDKELLDKMYRHWFL